MNHPQSREIARFYKEIGQRPVLQEWRSEIPADVRKMWLRTMIVNVGMEKLSESPFTHVIEECITDPHKKEQLKKLQENIEVLKHQDVQAATQPDTSLRYEDDGWDDDIKVTESPLEIARLDLEYFLQSIITDRTLAEFAKIYFTSFETDPKKVQEFFEQQQQHVAVIAQALQHVFNTGYAMIKPFFDYMRTPESYLSQRLKPSLDLSSIGKALVVYGSSAIGPRTEQYNKRGQDLDVFFLPEYPNAANTEQLTIVTGFFSCLDEILIKSKEELQAILPDIHKLFPQLVEVLDYLNTHQLEIDLRVPRIIQSNTIQPADWAKLCGPHRVVHTFSADWQTDYQQFVQNSINVARGKR